MSHNEIQDICSGDDIDFAFGEVYGIRQWQVRAPSVSYDTSDPSLVGHFNKTWHLGTNEAECYASQGGVMKIALTPEECRGRIQVGGNPIDVVLEMTTTRLKNRGVDVANLDNLDIEGGVMGGTFSMTTISYTNGLAGTSRRFKHPPITHRVPGSFYYAGDRFKPRIRLDRIDPDGTRIYIDIDTGESTMYRSIDDYTRMRSQIETAAPLYYEVSWKESGTCDSIAQPSCVCGFYAYTDLASIAQNSYNQPNSIIGIVRGHGKVTIGTKGFRAEKADIVALCAPVRLKIGDSWIDRIAAAKEGREPEPPKLTWEYIDKPVATLTEMQRLVRGTSIQIFENPDQVLNFARVHFGMFEV